MPSEHFKNAKAYNSALAADQGIALIPLTMAASILGVEPSTVQGYVRRGAIREIVVGSGRRWVGVAAADVHAMRTAKVTQLRSLSKQAEPILLAAAKRRELIEYGAELMRPLGLDHSLSKDRDMIGRVLGRISRRTHNRDGRLLSVLAVLKDGRKPNTPFFDLADSLGVMRAGESRDAFFAREMASVFRHYR